MPYFLTCLIRKLAICVPLLHPAAIWVRAWRLHHLVPWEKFRLDSYFGCTARSSFRKNFLWLGQWVVERESRDETRIRLPIWVSSITQVQSITNSEFSISNLSSFGEEESSIPVSSFAELGLRRWIASSVELVQSEYFGRSISFGVLQPESIRSGYWNEIQWIGLR